MVVDECHRATGKAEIVLALAHMRKARCQFRVLGLSATPGSSRGAIQVAAGRSARLLFDDSEFGCRACGGLCRNRPAANPVLTPSNPSRLDLICQNLHRLRE